MPDEQWSEDTFALYEMALSKVLSGWKVKLLMKGLRRYGPKLTGAVRGKVAPNTEVWIENLVAVPALEGSVGPRVQALAAEVSHEHLTDLVRVILEADVSLRPTRVARGALSAGSAEAPVASDWQVGEARESLPTVHRAETCASRWDKSPSTWMRRALRL